MSALVDEVVTVSEGEIAAALGILRRAASRWVEPTGALTTAVALAGRVPLAGRRVMALLCGEPRSAGSPAILAKSAK